MSRPPDRCFGAIAEGRDPDPDPEALGVLPTSLPDPTLEALGVLPSLAAVGDLTSLVSLDCLAGVDLPSSLCLDFEGVGLPSRVLPGVP